MNTSNHDQALSSKTIRLDKGSITHTLDESKFTSYQVIYHNIMCSTRNLFVGYYGFSKRIQSSDAMLGKSI